MHMTTRFGGSLLTPSHAFVLCSLLGCSEQPQTSASAAQPDAGATISQGGASGTGGSIGAAGASGSAGASGGSGGIGGSAGVGGQPTLDAGPPAPPSAY